MIHPWRLLGAAFFMASTLLLASCEKPEQSIGLNLQPEDELINVFRTDTFTITAEIIPEDSLRTDELSQMLLGNYFDPEIGRLSASFYSQVRLSTPDHDFGSNPVADSLVLSMRYTGELFGSQQPQFFEVFEMSDSLSLDSAYYSNQDHEITGANLVAPGVPPIRMDPRKEVSLANDTVPPQLRLRLSDELANDWVNLDPATYDSNDAWTSYFKGLYVRSSSYTGGIAHLDLVSSESGIRLYYHNDTDTSFFDYTINNVTARYSRFEHEFIGELAPLNTGEPVDAQVSPRVQSASGMKSLLTFPGLDSLNVNQERTINKAELIIPCAERSDLRKFYPTRLFLLTENDEGDIVGIPGQLSGTVEVGGFYELTENRYRFNVTRWLQLYLNGEVTVNYLYLVAGNAGVSARNVALNGPEHSLDDPSQNMRLQVTYSY